MNNHNEENRKPLVPKLRFPEFRNEPEWEEKKLGEIAEIVGGGTPETSIPEYWDGNIPWFTPSEIKSKYIANSSRMISSLGLKNSSAKILPKQTLLLSTRATVGDIGIATVECSTNQGFQSLIIKKSNNEFIYYWILGHKKELIRHASGSTFSEINKREVGKISLNIPSLPEQQKIADCLSSLDEVIGGRTKKLGALKKYKKGLMQKLFPKEGETLPYLRFPEFKNEPEWEEKKLGEVAIHVTDRNLSHQQNILTLSSEEGLIPQEQYFLKRIASKETLRYIHILKNDFVYNDRYTVKSPYGTIKRLSKYDEGIVSPIYSTFRPRKTVFPEYLEYYFESGCHEPEMNEIINEGARLGRFNISIKKFFSIYIYLPPILEQQKIADCLSSLDSLIGFQTKKIESLENHKKGLMQLLFPSPGAD